MSNLSRSSTVTSMLQLNCDLLTIMQYVHCLRNVHNQSTAICRQIVGYAQILKLNTSATIFLSLPDICMYFSVNTMHEIKYGIGMKIWKIAFHSILEFSIPFHSGIFHFPYRNFHSIFHSVPFYTMPCSSSGLRNVQSVQMHRGPPTSGGPPI